MRVPKINLNTLIASIVVTMLTACGGGGASQSIPVVNSPSPQPQSQAAWRITGSLQTARYDHTATRLADGRVLVVGGNYLTDNGQTLYPSNAELYDPANNVWTAAGTLATARIGHTTTLLPNGKVLVIGGIGKTNVETGYSGLVTSIELYDPLTNTWTIGPGLVTSRSRHTAMLLPNGKVLVAGGYPFGSNVGFAGMELYDPATNAWTAGGGLLASLAQHTATLLPDGRVLLMGGNEAAPKAELFDPIANTKVAAATPILDSFLGSATLLSSGNVLYIPQAQSNMVVPSAAALYNPTTDSWTSAGTLSTAHDGHNATRLGNGTVLVVGGGTSNVRQGKFATDIAELYDPMTNSWIVTKPLVQGPRLLHTSTLLSNGTVLVVGGTNSSGTFGPLAPPSAAAALYSN